MLFKQGKPEKDGLYWYVFPDEIGEEDVEARMGYFVHGTKKSYLEFLDGTMTSKVDSIFWGHPVELPSVEIEEQ